MLGFDDDACIERGKITVSAAAYKRIYKKLVRAHGDRVKTQRALAYDVCKAIKKRPGHALDIYKKMVLTYRSKTAQEVAAETGIGDPMMWPEEVIAEKVPVTLDPESWIKTAIFDHENKVRKGRDETRRLFDQLEPSANLIIAFFAVIDGGPGSPWTSYIEACEPKTYFSYYVKVSSVIELDEARKHPLATVFFGELRKIKRWTKDTGGVIYRREGLYKHEEFGS